MHIAWRAVQDSKFKATILVMEWAAPGKIGKLFQKYISWQFSPVPETRLNSTLRAFRSYVNVLHYIFCIIHWYNINNNNLKKVRFSHSFIHRVKNTVSRAANSHITKCCCHLILNGVRSGLLDVVAKEIWGTTSRSVWIRIINSPTARKVATDRIIG